MTHSKRQVNSGRLVRQSLAAKRFSLFLPFFLFLPLLPLSTLFLFPAEAHASAFTRPPNNLGLVGYWNFDEGSGTVAHDRSGQGNNGTLVNAPTWVKGKVNGALSFNGTNQCVDAGNASSLNVSAATGMAACAWLYLNSYSSSTALQARALI
ncbi:hypothetical protein KGO04_00145 [Patescibacteria group bacterium]|nr:hypothetical protein [Patescibacteria group bacterium]MDE1944649.1 hypothetical protein [Patescibacteria group bacterium]